MINFTLMDLYHNDEKLLKEISELPTYSYRNLNPQSDTNELSSVNINAWDLSQILDKIKPAYKISVGNYDIDVYGRECLSFLMIKNSDFNYIRKGEVLSLNRTIVTFEQSALMRQHITSHWQISEVIEKVIIENNFYNRITEIQENFILFLKNEKKLEFPDPTIIFLTEFFIDNDDIMFEYDEYIVKYPAGVMPKYPNFSSNLEAL